MTPARRQDEGEWDALFDFLAEESVNMSEEEIRADLRSHRIDITAAVNRVKRAITAAQARQALQDAPERRRRLLARLRNIAAQPLEDARDHLREILDTLGASAVQEVYFNRLEAAATDDDIRSLIEDLNALQIFDDED